VRNDRLALVELDPYGTYRPGKAQQLVKQDAQKKTAKTEEKDSIKETTVCTQGAAVGTKGNSRGKWKKRRKESSVDAQNTGGGERPRFNTKNKSWAMAERHKVRREEKRKKSNKKRIAR